MAAAAVAIGTAGATTAWAAPADPPFSVDAQALDQSLDCPTFTHPEHEPVLLVHGTGTRGHEQFDWNWLQVLPDMGFDVCVVTYPDRGLGDQQVSAEYVAHAVMTMHAATGRQVDLMGHSQGASMPRWAVRFWPSVRDAIDDYVGIAGPYHGTDVAGPQEGSDGVPQPEAAFQFRPGSRFVTILNEGDETPGDIDWTALASTFDELVRPTTTAFLDRGMDNPRVANVLLQDLCPGRVVDHLSIGTTDRLAFDLTWMPSPTTARPTRRGSTWARAARSPTSSSTAPTRPCRCPTCCSRAPRPASPTCTSRPTEPPTKDYAVAGEAAPSPAPTTEDADPAPAAADADVEPEAAPVPAAAPALPATGGGAGLLAIGALLGAVVSRRSRRGPGHPPAG